MARHEPGGGARVTRSLAGRLAWLLPTQAAVVLAFVFFRADSIGDAWALIAGVAAGHGLAAAATPRLAWAVGAILLLDLPVLLTDDQTWPLRWPLAPRVALYTLLLLALITLSGQQNQSSSSTSPSEPGVRERSWRRSRAGAEVSVEGAALSAPVACGSLASVQQAPTERRPPCARPDPADPRAARRRGWPVLQQPPI